MRTNPPAPGPAAPCSPESGRSAPSRGAPRRRGGRLLVLALVTGLLTTGALTGGAAAAGAPSAATPWRVPRLTVMPLGDSITQGVGSTTGDGYRAALRDALDDHATDVDFVGSLRHGTHADADHEGHSGYRIDQVAGGIGPWLAASRPNVITLHLGSNDINRDHQVDTAPARLAALLDRITAATPGTTVLLAPLVPNSKPGVQPRVDAFNRALPALVAERRQRGAKIRLVDFGAIGATDLVDGLHPNDSGYRKMAHAFRAGLARAARAGLISEQVTVDPSAPVTTAGAPVG
ncbi:SGNH/GDSL hydrolase family protein [Streptomyces sp. NPDC049906]|uniref:SGNH/GDSL hydrolase family protein n=1 Tax=Streptomyces sp. NPDC049906 TaxID=3155656 RepID=UPI0034172EF4